MQKILIEDTTLSSPIDSTESSTPRAETPKITISQCGSKKRIFSSFPSSQKSSIEQKNQDLLEELNNMKSNTTCNLSDLNLTDIPKELYEMTHLTQIDLSHNSISFLPVDFFYLILII
jgi:Leucine-rich repeat (LRR) protein